MLDYFCKHFQICKKHFIAFLFWKKHILIFLPIDKLKEEKGLHLKCGSWHGIDVTLHSAKLY